MNFSQYQKESRKTAIYKNQGKNLFYPVLGLVGEAGEIAEKLKRKLRGEKNTFQKKEISKELGDVLWYLSQLASELKLSLDDIAVENIKKLQSRKKRGKLLGRGDNR